MTSLAAPPSPASTPAASGGRGRILVVDDDRLVLATLVQGLSDAGYEVIDADNGDEAILFAREHRPALALLDIRMVGKSGFDVARTLRDPKYAIPFMFLSAFADETTQREVQALGALDYLVKPLDVGQIVPRVHAVFARIRSGDLRPLGPARSAPADAPAAPPTPAARASSAVVPAPAAPAAGAFPDLAAQAVPLAVGVLMHRHGLARQEAWQRLRALARACGRTEMAQAERLLDALEALAQCDPALPAGPQDPDNVK
jgi:DNA-binding response OmpR family regulator